MNSEKTLAFVDKFWEQDIIPTLSEYIRIPSLSPAFDKEWKQTGHIARAAGLMEAWAQKQNVSGAKYRIVYHEDLTPVLMVEIPATGGNTKNVLMYGHMDKQPPMEDKWDEGLHPWTPTIKENKAGRVLYGRGGADDGYAIFASVCALKALEEQGASRPRCVVLIEASEESGSIHLPPYITLLQAEIGVPDLVVCLDSGAGNYEQLWMTTSLRGVVNATVKATVLEQAMHSGAASGVVPSSFRVLRQILERIEDTATGAVRLPELHTQIPPSRLEEAKLCAQVLGETIYTEFPFAQGVKPMGTDLVELLLNKTWRPTLSVIGADGLPPAATAGNVLRTDTTLKVSLRIPPQVDPKVASAAVHKALSENPPYNAQVEAKVLSAAAGWSAPILSERTSQIIDKAARTFFQDKPPVSYGEGGTIPFMAMLSEKFPKAEFVITGLLGPGSNAHGPNEFLHIDYAKRLTAAVATILASI